MSALMIMMLIISKIAWEKVMSLLPYDFQVCYVFHLIAVHAPRRSAGRISAKD
jgi:hypothetical protein